MQRDECAAVIFGREILALIELDLERRGVGLEEHIGDAHVVFQVGMLAFVARIFMAAYVKPRPAVEGAFTCVA